MGYADEQAYEEMISELNDFITGINESCAALNSAAKDCVDNMNDDINVQGMEAALANKVNAIQQTTDTASALIQALSNELEAIRDTHTDWD